MQWKIDDELLFEWISSNGMCIPQTTFEVISYVDEYAKKLGVGFDVKKHLTSLHNNEPILYLSDKRYRDHVRHACRVAILGDMLLSGKLLVTRGRSEQKVRLIELAGELMKRNPAYSALFKSESVPTEGEEFNKFILRTWYVAALFHDIGKAFDAYLQVRKNVEFLENFERLATFFGKFEIGLAELKEKLGYPRLSKDKVSFSEKGINHAQIGAMYVNSLSEGKTDPLLEVASHVICLHNSNNQVNFTEEPLAFMLILIDEIQEWNRQLVDRPMLLESFDRQTKRKGLLPVELLSIRTESDIDSAFAWDLIKHKGKLLLSFILDYDDSSISLMKTGFNFPFAIYSKEQALSRLRLGSSDVLENIVKEHLKGSPQFKLDIKVDLVASNSLSQEWDRQTRHLYTRATREGNRVLNEWVHTLMTMPGYEFQEKKLSLKPLTMQPPPSMLEGHMVGSMDFYLLERDIQEPEINEWVKYKSDSKSGLINATIRLKRVWQNRTEPNKPIREASVTLGDIHPKATGDTLTYVKIDGKGDYKDKVISISFPKSKEKRVDQLAIIFPFEELPPKTALTNKITVEYLYNLLIPKDDLQIDAFSNMRRSKIESMTMEVRFEKKLFKDNFAGGIPRRARYPLWQPERLQKYIERIKGKIELGVPPIEFVPWQEVQRENEMIFKHTFKDIETYQSIGWVWIPR